MAQFFGQGNFRYGHAFDQTFWPSRQAILSRNIASRQGREDYIRVRLEHQANGLPRAVPVPGLSGLLRTLLDSEGLVRISARIEGLEAGTPVVSYFLKADFLKSSRSLAGFPIAVKKPS